ncbi:CU044_5270 family protein [Kribbella sp. CWNU-51]
MNEIDLLKRVRDDVPPPTPVALARARQRLVIQPPVRRRSTSRRRVLVAGALAATLAAGFLVNDVVTRDGGTATPGAIADASTFLATAAAHTSANRDAPIPPGQYRQITQRTQRTWNFGPGNKFHGTSLDVTNWWVTADQNPPYTVIFELNAKKTFSSEAARKLWNKTDPLNIKPETLKSRDACGVGMQGGSIAPRGRGNVCTPSLLSPSGDYLARLPRDPDALLAALRKQNPMLRFPHMDPKVANARVFDSMVTILASGIAPADLRAALYQAARQIPGIQLQADAVNLDGRSGRAISLVEQFGIRKELIIDSRTGQFLGLREVATMTAPLNGDGDPMPLKRGDIVTWTSVSTRITPTRPTVH